MTDYYDRDGTPMAQLDWIASFSDYTKKIVKKTKVDDVEVSTVWLGLDHGFGNGPPLIFETMIFGGEYNEEMWRYSTEDSAAKGHERIVNALTNGDNPNET